MLTEQIITGGEEAGGMGLPNYIPERDGILAGLVLCMFLLCNKKVSFFLWLWCIMLICLL